jgi:hypothetical protein
MFANIIRGWNEMSLYRKIRRVLMIGLAIFGLWALTPYLYNRTVNEEFPAPVAAPAAQAPAAPTAMAMQPAIAPTAMAMAEAPAAPTAMAMAEAPAPPTAMPAAPSGPVALSTGSFIPGSTPGDRAEGSATIFRLEDGVQVVRLQDFKTTNGPDLFVVLASSANPDQDGVKSGEYLQLAALKGNQGNQNYELPADADLGKYKSVVIWCRTFNVVFGYATLAKAP